LNSRDRHATSLVVCLLALCTVAHHAQVGQEGIGKTHQMQVYKCVPVRAVLVLTQPSQLLGVLPKLLNDPAFFVRPDDFRDGELRGDSNQP
jgi:hypothetical protein